MKAIIAAVLLTALPVWADVKIELRRDAIDAADRCCLAAGRTHAGCVFSAVPLRRAQRLARHLWRMCFALFIATASFFSIRERVASVLPEAFTSGWMRALPILVLAGAMVYCLWRVRGPVESALPRARVARFRVAAAETAAAAHGLSD